MLRAALYLLALTDPYRYERLETVVYRARRLVSDASRFVTGALIDAEWALNDIACAAGQATDAAAGDEHVEH